MSEHQQRWEASGVSPPLNSHRNCTACKRSHALSEFYKKGNRFDARCKTCVKESKTKTRRLKAKQIKTLSKFKVEFTGEPDKSLLAERLSILLSI